MDSQQEEGSSIGLANNAFKSEPLLSQRSFKKASSTSSVKLPRKSPGVTPEDMTAMLSKLKVVDSPKVPRKSSRKGSTSNLSSKGKLSSPPWMGSAAQSEDLSPDHAVLLRRLKIALVLAEGMLKAYKERSAGPKLDEVLERLTDLEDEIVTPYVDLLELRSKPLGITLVRAGRVLENLRVLIAELPSREASSQKTQGQASPQQSVAGSTVSLSNPAAMSALEREIEVYMQRLSPLSLPCIEEMTEPEEIKAVMESTPLGSKRIPRS